MSRTRPATPRYSSRPKEPANLRFGQLLHYHRVGQGITVRQFAYLSAFPPTRVARLERGEIEVTARTVFRVADILGVEAADLLPPSPR